ncbi:hypothetical protein PENCOP_c015G06808 [Penicillium coprophilum]|uniref:NWD NACHT-NTPase N-terminal domain-containing protein n=1 Tax=Penicillium coprophilum TaxID=36646 RepID=A0A1V6U9T1_9EURO|nr:hypothetical protein PENCOP_c015G06808 [Penicillium coprophilum]
MRHFLHRGHDSRGKQHETPETSNPKAKRSVRDHFKAKFSPRRHDTRDTAEGTVTETSSCREENHDDGPSRLESSSPCVEVSVTSPPTLRKSTQTLEELVMRDLWKIALERLQGNKGRLLATYGQDLVRGCNNDENTEGRPEEDQSNQVKMQQQQQLVYEALRQLEDGQLFIPRRCRQNAIGDHVQRIIQTILSVKDVISQAISAEPHAALAWAGVLVVLPLLLKPFTQIEEAAKGIEFISKLLIRYQVVQTSHIQNLLALAWMDVIEEMGETQYPYRVTLWDLAKNKALCEFEPESKSDFLAGLKQVAISPNNATIALSSICRIYLYDSAGNILYSLGHGEDAAVLAFSANGELLASGNQTVSIWKTATGQKMKEIQVQALVNEISFTDEDRFVLTSEGRFSTASIMANDEDAYGTGLFCRDLYIMNGRNRVLALSPEFLGPEPPLPRGVFASVRGGKVAMVSPPHRVGIFGLNTDVDHIL